MNIHFNDTRPARAPAATLWEVITDYAGYPRFNSAVINVRVAKKDDTGAEFLADRKTRIGKTVRAYDRYVHPDNPLNAEKRDYLQVEKDAWNARRRIGDIPVPIIQRRPVRGDDQGRDVPLRTARAAAQCRWPEGLAGSQPASEADRGPHRHAVEEADPDLVIDAISTS